MNNPHTGDTSEAHIVGEMGMRFTHFEDEALHGVASVTNHLCLPGTNVLRASVVATWADVATGVVAGRATTPRIPVTCDLEVHMVSPARSSAELDIVAAPIKVGRSVAVIRSDVRDRSSGRLVATATVSFMPNHQSADMFGPGTSFPEFRGSLTVPLAERIGRRRVDAGIVEIPRLPDGQNTMGAIQGGLLTVAAEEAVVASMADGVEVDSLSVRYLRPFLVGPARATCSTEGNLHIVEVVDVGSGKLGLLATIRTRQPAAWRASSENSVTATI